MKNTFTHHGFGLVEAIIAISIIVSALAGAVSAHRRFVTVTLQNTSQVKAHYLAEEGLEIARYLRDQGWAGTFAALTNGVSYHLVFATTTGMWQATTTSQIIDGVFERTLTLEPVYRRTSDDDIVASTSPDIKAIDPDIRTVTVRVSASGTPDLVLSTYLANLFES
jgi:type II secretory pathway pseudopilin PulG